MKHGTEPLPTIWQQYADSRPAGWFDFRREVELAPLEPKAQAPAERTARRPDLNGYHLNNPDGTIWTVVDGHARGWVSAALFERVHYWERCTWEGDGIQYYLCRRIRLTPIDDIRFYSELAPWNDDVRLVRNAAGTVCLFETPRGEAHPVLYCVPSEKVMNWYQFDWDKVQQISDEEFNSYSVRVVMTMPDGSM